MSVTNARIAPCLTILRWVSTDAARLPNAYAHMLCGGSGVVSKLQRSSAKSGVVHLRSGDHVIFWVLYERCQTRDNAQVNDALSNIVSLGHVAQCRGGEPLFGGARHNHTSAGGSACSWRITALSNLRVWVVCVFKHQHHGLYGTLANHLLVELQQVGCVHVS